MSVPMNIAEGAGRSTPPEFARFLSIAAGSLNELEYQLELAADLGFGSADLGTDLRAEVAEIRAMVTALRRKVNPPRSD